MTNEEVLAWYLTGDDVSELDKWRAVITDALDSGFTLSGVYQAHKMITPPPTPPELAHVLVLLQETLS